MRRGYGQDLYILQDKHLFIVCVVFVVQGQISLQMRSACLVRLDLSQISQARASKAKGIGAEVKSKKREGDQIMTSNEERALLCILMTHNIIYCLRRCTARRKV